VEEVGRRSGAGDGVALVTRWPWWRGGGWSRAGAGDRV